MAGKANIKRAKVEDDDAEFQEPVPESYSRSEVDQLLADFNESTKQTVMEQAAATATELNTNLPESIRRMEKVQEQRDVENKAAIADVSRRQTS